MAGCASCLHKNVHPNVCSDCLGGTHYKPRKPRNKTNADRFSSKTPEELAKLFSHLCCPYSLGGKVDCNAEKNGCYQCWLDWLRQEAECDAQS